MIDEIEAVETAALRDLHDATTDDLRGLLGIQSHESGSTFVSIAGALPDTAIVINRTIGLGLSEPATRDSIASIVAAYNEAFVTRYFVHVHPKASPDNLEAWLTGFVLESARGWMKFQRGRSAPPPSTTDLEVRLATRDDASVLGSILCSAFDLGAVAAPWISRLIGRPGWRVYTSCDGGTLAGTGSMFIQDRVAWIDWGATAPEFRGRGSQSAILARRISDALDFDCKLIATTTGEEVPGEPQHLYSNILRKGFEPAYVKNNYAPPNRRLNQ